MRGWEGLKAEHSKGRCYVTPGKWLSLSGQPCSECVTGPYELRGQALQGSRSCWGEKSLPVRAGLSYKPWDAELRPQNRPSEPHTPGPKNGRGSGSKLGLRAASLRVRQE